MLEALVAGICLAIVSAVTFFAYKHPRGYKTLYFVFIIITSVFMVSAGAYVYGVHSAKMLVLKSNILDPSVSFKVEELMDSAVIPAWIGVGLPMAWIAYLFFLLLLPYWLTKDQNHS
jgi:hypothetical protein